MRFKTLRIVVGVALIIFILIIGNILLFSNIENGDSKISRKTIALIDNKNVIQQKNIIVSNPDTNNIIKSEPTIIQNPTPVVIHHSIRTRAS